MRLVAIVASFAVLAGACAPGARPYGIGAGTILAAIGGGILIDAKTTSCPAPPPPDMGITLPFSGVESAACEFGTGLESAFGTVLLVGGLVTLIAAAASPSAPEPARVTALLPAAVDPAPSYQPPPRSVHTGPDDVDRSSE